MQYARLVILFLKAPLLSIPVLAVCAIFGGLAYWKHSLYWLIPIPIVIGGGLVFFLYITTRYIQ